MLGVFKTVSMIAVKTTHTVLCDAFGYLWFDLNDFSSDYFQGAERLIAALESLQYDPEDEASLDPLSLAAVRRSLVTIRSADLELALLELPLHLVGALMRALVEVSEGISAGELTSRFEVCNLFVIAQ